MNFKKWLKSIQTAGYNGARMVSKGPFIYHVSTCRVEVGVVTYFQKLKHFSNRIEKLYKMFIGFIIKFITAASK